MNELLTYQWVPAYHRTKGFTIFLRFPFAYFDVLRDVSSSVQKGSSWTFSHLETTYRITDSYMHPSRQMLVNVQLKIQFHVLRMVIIRIEDFSANAPAARRQRVSTHTKHRSPFIQTMTSTFYSREVSCCFMERYYSVIRYEIPLSPPISPFLTKQPAELFRSRRWIGGSAVTRGRAASLWPWRRFWAGEQRQPARRQTARDCEGREGRNPRSWDDSKRGRSG